MDDQRGDDEHGDWRASTAREHEEKLTGYRALLARIEAAAGEAQLAADDTGAINTSNPFTEDLRFLIGMGEQVLKRLRGDDSLPDTGPEERETTNPRI